MNIVLIWSDLGKVWKDGAEGTVIFNLVDAPEWILECHNVYCGVSHDWQNKPFSERQLDVIFRLKEYLIGKDCKTQRDPLFLQKDSHVVFAGNFTSLKTVEAWKESLRDEEEEEANSQ